MQSPALPPDPSASTPKNNRLKTFLVVGGAGTLLGIAVLVFWYQDARYSLPTPKPPGLVALNNGQPVALPAPFAPAAQDERPLFLHFFNPDCPCSRFNADHVRTLRARFGSRVRFVAVVQVPQDQDAAARRRSLAATARLFGPEMETAVDDGGKIAAACGVYSTPQAVILSPDAHRTLLFRGNYNSARYCADPRTEFARLALEALIEHRPPPVESRDAMIAYGCQLPANLTAATAASTGVSAKRGL